MFGFQVRRKGTEAEGTIVSAPEFTEGTALVVVIWKGEENFECVDVNSLQAIPYEELAERDQDTSLPPLTLVPDHDPTIN
jgi:hypothetical protein